LSREPLRAVVPLAERHEFGAFDCGVESLAHWLRRSARTAAASGTAVTYVLCRGDLVVGYYSLAMSSLAHDGASSRLRRGMPDPDPVAVVLLARFALDRSEQGSGLGGELLVDALRRCVRGAREFGARAIVVDAASEAAASFYRHFGFHELEGARLWRRVSDVEHAL
jgi:predicted N-acetyltransferase YhbS